MMSRYLSVQRASRDAVFVLLAQRAIETVQQIYPDTIGSLKVVHVNGCADQTIRSLVGARVGLPHMFLWFDLIPQRHRFDRLK